jgi:hypothetical protein
MSGRSTNTRTSRAPSPSPYPNLELQGGKVTGTLVDVETGVGGVEREGVGSRGTNVDGGGFVSPRAIRFPDEE